MAARIDLSAVRSEYMRRGLNFRTCPADPFELFNLWIRQALESGVADFNAMNLATVDSGNRPHSRIVLLKGVEGGALVFFTNYESLKGRNLETNPFAAVNFFWAVLQRQIRVEGEVRKISSERSDEYFSSRPLASRYGAWASNQSEVIQDDLDLLKKAASVAVRYPVNPPRPEYWGGYELIPDFFEFWQGKPSRLHDRIIYRLSSDGGWKRFRLSP